MVMETQRISFEPRKKENVTVDYHRVAYVTVKDPDIMCSLTDQSPWGEGEMAICQTVEHLVEIEKEAPSDSPLGEFLNEVLSLFEETSFDGDVIFEVE